MSAPPALDKSALFAARDLLRQARSAATVQSDVKTPPKSADNGSVVQLNAQDLERVVSRVTTPHYAFRTIKMLYRRGDIVEDHNILQPSQNDTHNAFFDLFNSAGAIEETRLRWHISRLLRGEYITSGSLCIARYEGEGIGPVYCLYRNGVEVAIEAYTHNLKGRVMRMARVALARGWVVNKTVKVKGRADCDGLELSRDDLIKAGAIAAELTDIAKNAG